MTLAERSLLAGLSVTMLLLPGIYGLTPWLNFANYNWIPATSALVGSGGVPVLVIAIWLFWRSHRDLANQTHQLDDREYWQAILLLDPETKLAQQPNVGGSAYSPLEPAAE